MSDLRSRLIRLAYDNPEIRDDLLPLVRQAQYVLQNADGGRYDIKPPRSMYDRLQPAPFRWSTPAKNIDGSYPLPWRVSDKDDAFTWVKNLARRVDGDYRDLYVDYWQQNRGFETLWVGLRNNRYREEHAGRLRALFNELRKFSKVVMQDGWILLVDDIPKDALR